MTAWQKIGAYTWKQKLLSVEHVPRINIDSMVAAVDLLDAAMKTRMSMLDQDFSDIINLLPLLYIKSIRLTFTNWTFQAIDWVLQSLYDLYNVLTG